MTWFIDLREIPSGGSTARQARLWDDGNRLLDDAELAKQVRNQDLVLVTHGFNVGRRAGVAHISQWQAGYQLAAQTLFVGVLWPGDSRFFPIIDYPWEGSEAIRSGQLLARYLNQFAASARAVSFVSHSLGARMVLEAVRHLSRRTRRLVLMAAAIENDTLSHEYADAAAKVDLVHVVASREDWVLEYAFPSGNLVGDIVRWQHPYFAEALGRNGPAGPPAAGQVAPLWQAPDDWDYGHLDYLPGDPLAAVWPPPAALPTDTTAEPTNPPDDLWKPVWSAQVGSTALK